MDWVFDKFKEFIFIFLGEITDLWLCLKRAMFSKSVDEMIGYV